ncbi:MAG: tetratricopeptide repeat protein [Planctomycetes bacterium]|nr:tetratricopeptide repeat protein [Planctomycetota bacterium]
MVIHKKENFKLLSCLVVIIFAATASNLTASELSARKAMQKTYQVKDSISRDQAKELVGLVRKESANIRNNYLLSRINYRTGLLYYKASMLDESAEMFLKTANNDKFTPVICAASYNMAAMIFKQQGRYGDAIKQFEKIASLTIDDYKLNDKNTPAILKLGCLALFNIANIHQSQGDIDLAIVAYGRLLGILSYSREERFRKYVPIAKDRLAQLYLQKKQPHKYIAVCQGLLVDYPNYYRWPLINFEIKCIKCIQQIAGTDQLPQTSYAAPAVLTRLFKNTPEKETLADHITKFEFDISQEPGNYAQLLINYYCSWLFDSVGKKQLALKSLQAINKNIPNKTSYDNLDTIFTAIRQYAKIFQAVILTESNHYSQAQDILALVKQVENQPHISKLIYSVNKNIEILKREVIKNVNK